MNYQTYRKQQTCIKCGWPTYDGMVHHCPSAPMRDSVTFVTNDSARIDALEKRVAHLEKLIEAISRRDPNYGKNVAQGGQKP